MSFFGDLGGSISSDLAGMAFNAWQADKQMDFKQKWRLRSISALQMIYRPLD